MFLGVQAIDRETREIVGVAVGDRRRQTAFEVSVFRRKTETSKRVVGFIARSLSPNFVRSVARSCAVSYTDFWEAYEFIFPSHRAVGKETGKTNQIERFNCTLRQRISRVVRKTLFQKTLKSYWSNLVLHSPLIFFLPKPVSDFSCLSLLIELE
jgi:IS1 family transposase